MKLANIKKYLPHFLIISTGIFIGWVIQPASLEKYIGQLVNENNQLLADGQKIAYVDYDYDGYSEQFVYYHMSDNRQPVVNQYSNAGDFQNVWYLDGEVVDNFDFIVGDYNHDSIAEVYVFSLDSDGVYLYGLLPGKSNQFFPKKRNICEFKENINAKHFVIRGTELADLNQDGYGELIFFINARFSNSPRKLFAYDVKNDSLISSAEFGMQLIGSPIIFDIDANGSPEIFLSTLNSTNQGWVGEDLGLYSASVVLNANLSYLFVPILYESRMSVTSTFPYTTSNGNFIASLSWSLREKETPKLILLNKNGERLHQQNLINKNFVFDPNRNNWSDLFMFCKKGVIEKYNNQLQQVQSYGFKHALNQVEFIDIDKDGTQELIAVHNNFITIYRENYSNPVKIEIPGLGIKKLTFSIKSNGPKPNYLSIQSENHQYLVEYQRNNYYWLNYLLYFVCILILYIIYLIIHRYYQDRVNTAKFRNEKFFEMQLDLIKSQLDPHFLFNALNSIAFSINKDDRKTAYANLGQFSKFMRESIVSMDEFSRTLEEEIGYVQNYLTLEKFRFKEKFDYDFIISPEVNKSVIIPKLIIFSFTESALKKSVLPKNGGGRIVFTIDAIGKESIFISISENGIHRNLEKDSESHTINMMLMNRIVDYFNSFNINPIEISIKDNGTAENPKGSCVEILVPVDYKYII